MNEGRNESANYISGGMRAPENVLPKRPWVWIADPLKAGICLFAFVFLTIVAATMAAIGRVVSGVIFFAVALGFLYVLTYYGAVLRVDEKGVRKSFLGLFRRSLRWEEIREMGVAGTRIFHRGNKNRAGTLYLYFASEEMDDDARFGMMLKWPQHDRIFLRFSHKRFAALQVWRPEAAVRYNVGKLVL